MNTTMTRCPHCNHYTLSHQKGGKCIAKGCRCTGKAPKVVAHRIKGEGR
jgi:rRNA maturation protein Nop10